MITHESLTRQEAAERDAGIDTWLTEFNKIVDPELGVLRFNLRKSWERYVEKHIHSLLRDLRDPENRIKPKTEESIKMIRILTRADRKWHILSQLIHQAGYEAIWDNSPFDEESEHRWLRTQDDFPNRYSMRVAHSKQSFDLLQTPVFTLDTVTLVDGLPTEKPKTIEEAQAMITQMSGKQVSTETGWVFGIQVKSGASVTLLNKTGITYHVKPVLVSNINRYLQTASSIFDVSGGIDLSSVHARTEFIDMSKPAIVYCENNYADTGQLTLRGEDLKSPLFDSFFAGVPVYAVKALLPLIPAIYLHGDPFYKKTPYPETKTLETS